MDYGKLVGGLVASAAALALVGCANQGEAPSGTQGTSVSQSATSGNPATEEGGSASMGTVASQENGTQTRNYDLSGFERIEVGGAFKVNVKVGEAESVKVTGEDVLFDHLQVSVKDGTLHVGTKGWFNMSGTLELVVTMPKMTGFEGSGAVNATIDNVKSSDFDLGLSGAAKAALDGVAQNVKVDLSGSGRADLTNFGVSNLDLEGSGAGSMNLGEIDGDAKIHLSGACKVTAASVKNLDCDLSGASSVKMPTSGDVKFEASGASSASVGPNANIVSKSVSGASSLSQK